MKDSTFVILSTFLKKSNRILNLEELHLQLLSHPSYPSLYSITNVLDHFGITNIALEVPVNMETLEQLPRYFISRTSEEGGLVMVTKKKGAIEIFSGDKFKTSVSFTGFLNIWSGLVMAIDDEDAQVINKNGRAKPLRQIGYLGSGIILLSVFFLSRPSLFQAMHYLLSVLGLGMSFLIVRHELGFQSKIIDQLCSANKITSCEAVLSSKASAISKYLKVSDISMIYFTGLVLSWMLSLPLQGDNAAAAWVSLLVLPVTFYSIHYQNNVVKKWCPLCLGIAGVLWLQAGSLWLIRDSLMLAESGLREVSLFLLCFLTAVTFWVFVRPLLDNRQELKKHKLAHLKFKRNFDLFYAALSKNNTLDIVIEELRDKEIVLGNKNAHLSMLVVTNPLCVYCKTLHTDLETILKRYGDDISITIRFNVGVKDRSSMAHKVSNRLLDIYSAKPERQYYRALHEAYLDDVDMENWLSQWRGTANGNFFDAVLEAQQNWCHTHGIHFTPALFINGKEFPKPYERSDVVYYIENLLEHLAEEAESRELAVKLDS
jgi:uncharacterized membrane protein